MLKEMYVCVKSSMHDSTSHSSESGFSNANNSVVAKREGSHIRGLDAASSERACLCYCCSLCHQSILWMPEKIVVRESCHGGVTAVL